MMKETTYSEAILEGFKYLLDNYEEVFVIGQGLWSPWYVGNSMKDLDKLYGKKRIIDTPVSENAVTGAAVGASLCDTKPIVVHPRMDFMLYAMDPIINQAAKWSYMYGGQANPNLTIRSIVNRGGEQGAQHSQLLHSLFAHIPGLRVVMPYSVSDARDLLIASVLCKDPVIYIDDRWLYEEKDKISDIKVLELSEINTQTIMNGNDITIISSGYSTKITKNAINKFKGIYKNASIELIDLRVINPIKYDDLVKSVYKTRRLMTIDGGWKTCGLGAEIISSIVERIEPKLLLSKPINISLRNAPAPASKVLENNYYLKEEDIIIELKKVFSSAS